MVFKFGDVLENGWAGEKNPTRIGIFVKTTLKGFEMTDGKGKFWVQSKVDHRLTKIGSVLNHNEETKKDCKHENIDYYNNGYHAVCRDCGKDMD